MRIGFAPEFQRKKIFILGSTGFVGSALTKVLIQIGFNNLHCLYRNEFKKKQIFHELDTSCVSFLKGDIFDETTIRNGIKNADIVINTVGITSDWGSHAKFEQLNFEAVKKLATIIRDSDTRPHLIHLSAAMIYGFGKGYKSENYPLVASDPFFTASKVACHRWLRAEMQAGLPFPVTILAPAMVWGPGDQRIIPALIGLMEQKLMFYWGKSRAIDWVHIDDLVDAILLCFFNRNSYNQEFIINGPKPFPFRKYVRKVAEYAEMKVPTPGIPIFILMFLALIAESAARYMNRKNPEFRPFITRFRVTSFTRPLNLSIEKASHVLGYSPQMVFEYAIDSIKDYIQNEDLWRLNFQMDEGFR